MGGYLLLILFLICGICTSVGLFKRESGLFRLWTGLSVGLMMMMFLPLPYAFLFTFNQTAQYAALGTAAAIAILSVFLNKDRSRRKLGFMGDISLPMFLALIIPLVVLCGWLQYSHILRPVDGSFHVGQSTYGDLCLHLGIATSLQNATFPADYSILKGALLCYPFLSDSMVTSMLLFGADLRLSFIITGTLMMTLVGVGVVFLARQISRKPAVIVIAFVLFFINGGLGFIYAFDGITKNPSALLETFPGLYKTPTNQPALNPRWA
ncbi:MAG: hypothetical protein MJ099_01225, partial [Clostridia bacterium]|nr:hypothetical protein [Clostridia bacterium]